MINRAAITNWSVAHPLVHDAWRQDGAHSERVSGEHGGEAGVT